MIEERLENQVQNRLRHLVVPLDRVPAVHEHLGLDNWHQPRLLAQRGKARQTVGMGRQTGPRRNIRPDANHRAPLAEPRSEPRILGQPLAQTVESLRDFLAGKTRERLNALVHLDPRNDALSREHLDQRRPVRRRLPQRFLKQDDAADEFAQTRRSEEQLAIRAPVPSVHSAPTLLKRFSMVP